MTCNTTADSAWEHYDTNACFLLPLLIPLLSALSDPPEAIPEAIKGRQQQRPV